MNYANNIIAIEKRCFFSKSYIVLIKNICRLRLSYVKGTIKKRVALIMLTNANNILVYWSF